MSSLLLVFSVDGLLILTSCSCGPTPECRWQLRVTPARCCPTRRSRRRRSWTRSWTVRARRSFPPAGCGTTASFCHTKPGRFSETLWTSSNSSGTNCPQRRRGLHCYGCRRPPAPRFHICTSDLAPVFMGHQTSVKGAEMHQILYRNLRDADGSRGPSYFLNLFPVCVPYGFLSHKRNRWCCFVNLWVI